MKRENFFRYVEDIDFFLVEVLQENKVDELDSDLVSGLRRLRTTLDKLLED